MSVEGRPIKMAVLGEGPTTVLFMGVIHGNEPAGKELMDRLHARLYINPADHEGKRVLIVPVLNPDGLAGRMRRNANQVDINRNFPTNNWTSKPDRRKYDPGPEPASEPETRVIIKLIEEEKPRLIVVVHQPFECVNYDGPAVGYAKQLVVSTGLPLKHDIGYNTPGSLGTYAGVEKSIPTITFELGRSKSINPDDYYKIYVPAFIELIQSVN